MDIFSTINKPDTSEKIINVNTESSITPVGKQENSFRSRRSLIRDLVDTTGQHSTKSTVVPVESIKLSVEPISSGAAELAVFKEDVKKEEVCVTNLTEVECVRMLDATEAVCLKMLNKTKQACLTMLKEAGSK